MNSISNNGIKSPRQCAVCGSYKFKSDDVLWPALIQAWELSKQEELYINEQQGTCCEGCHNNLRGIALAAAVLKTYDYNGTLESFCNKSNNLRVLEINPSANLTSFFNNLPSHQLIEYPEHDMLNLDFQNESFDLIIHSDTLEHVPNPIAGLKECRRLLSPQGKCIFTVPIIIERLNRNRAEMPPSYHGSAECSDDDQLVYTEFGADVWSTVLSAGFGNCTMFSLEYPAAIAIIAYD